MDNQYKFDEIADIFTGIRVKRYQKGQVKIQKVLKKTYEDSSKFEIEFEEVSEKYGVDLISLIAPTSAGRIAMIAKEAKGFIYIVSSLGVTGTRSAITTDVASIVKVVKENTDVPCAIGFGISNPEQAAKMAAWADGVIVGSAIVKLIEKHGKDSVKPVGEFVHDMKTAIS